MRIPSSRRGSIGHRTHRQNAKKNQVGHRSDAHGVQTTATDGQIFSDGAIIDLLRSGSPDKGFKLILRDRARITIESTVQRDGQVFVPIAIEESVAKALRFPSRVCAYGSTQQLLNDIGNFLKKHPGLVSESVLVIAYFVLATFFPDCGLSLPFLSVVSPDSSARSLLVHLLHRICRRALHLTDVTREGLLSLPLALRPTLLIDQKSPSPGLLKMLSAMTRPGALVPRHGRLCDVACPTVICTSEPLADSALLERTIPVVLISVPGCLQPVDEESLSPVASELQAKLLQYRLQNFSTVRRGNFEALGLTSPIADIARALGACVVDDCELQSRIIPLLSGMDEETRERRSASLQGVCAEAALFLVHEKNRRCAYVGEVTDIFNGILKGRGESIELDPRAVGPILRSLGLHTGRLGSAGNGVKFFRETRRRIHQVAWSFDVPGIYSATKGCEFCDEMRSLNVKQE